MALPFYAAMVILSLAAAALPKYTPIEQHDFAFVQRRATKVKRSDVVNDARMTSIASSKSSDQENRMSVGPRGCCNGATLSIHLSEHKFTEVFQQGDVALYAKDGHSGDDDAKLMMDVSVRVHGREFVRVAQRRGHVDKQQASMDLTLEGGPGHTGLHQSLAHGALKVFPSATSTEFWYVPEGLHFVIASRRTNRQNAPDSHHLIIKFLAGLPNVDAPAAQGILPEISRVQPQIFASSALHYQRKGGNLSDVSSGNRTDKGVIH
eukprot:TRINITY_DN6526_c0_g2_i1.p2 TRINITY_DN6526_c0_g2~~TRINITY_DN6526_c0_g2_i1.p2  ORF type:complete len:264 (+),score=32.51 TRINITY_DN6526_c0_g2_i1:971-1762(+)